MTNHTTLLGEIENFLNASGVNATAFGRDAARDPNFVHDLRNGRSPTEKTATRVRAFMRSHAKQAVERLTPYAEAAPDGS